MQVITGFLIVLTAAFEVQATLWDIFPGQSIQEAADQAADGDTILLHDGQYTETVVFDGRRLTIGSEFLLDRDTSHIGSTVIMPDYSRPDTASCFVYMYQAVPGHRLVGLSLTGGFGTQTGPSGPAGGAVHVFRSRVSLEHVRITSCYADFGGGVWVNGAGRMDACAEIRDCLFESCEASFFGGAFYAVDCSTRLYRCQLHSNTANGSAGAAILMDSFVEIVETDIISCWGGDAGGVQYLGCWGIISDCHFELNSSGVHGFTDLMFIESDAPIIRCTFTRNGEATNSVLLSRGRFPLRFLGNVLVGNSATETTTGTLILSNGARGDVAYCLFQDNVNISGGALYVTHPSTPRIHHCAFAQNASLDSQYAANVLTNGTPFTLDSNIFEGCTGSSVGYVPSAPATIDARYNYWGDPTGPYHPTLNPEGRGDTLLQDCVLFDPWLTDPPDTTMPSDFSERSRPEISTTWRLAGVYPNPFNNTVRIIIAGFTRSDFRLTLHNLLGQEVDVIHAGALTGGELSYTASPTLSTGVYFLRASSRDNVETRKVVFMK